MKVGISEIVLPELTMGDFFQRSSAAGYEVVEICLGGEKSPLQLHTKETLIPEINSLSRQYNLPVASLVHWQCTGNLLASGSGQRMSIEQTCEGLEIARKVGAKCTLHTLGAMTPDLCYDEAYENAVYSLKEIAKTAEKTGVAVAVEFMWNGFLFSPLEMKRFLEEIGSEFIGFYFDPGNMAVFQYPQHWARILGKYVKMVHMKDWEGNALNGGWPGLLEGSLDFKRIMSELRRAGYDGPLISEVDVASASIEKTAEAIRKIITM